MRSLANILLCQTINLIEIKFDRPMQYIYIYRNIIQKAKIFLPICIEKSNSINDIFQFISLKSVKK